MAGHGPVGDFPLASKILLVTGGGSGISLRIAQLVLEAGARGIIIADLILNPAAEEFVSSNSSKVVYQKTDVCDWAQLKALFVLSKEKFGDVPDVYLLGAGIFEPPGHSFWDESRDELEGGGQGRYLELDVNVGHVIKLTRMAMRACLGANKKAVVCSIASGLGLEGFYTTPLYCADKHAVVGFTKSMKMADNFEGIKVCAFCPGIVDTPLWEIGGRRAQFSLDKNEDLLTVEEVAVGTIDLIVSGKYAGGAVVEQVKVDGKAETRSIPDWNIDPPRHGAFVRKLRADPTIAKQMAKPILERTANERATAWP